MAKTSHKRSLTVFLMLTILTLFGCSNGIDTKLDASSQEALKSSSEIILKELSPEQAGQFREALQIVLYDSLGQSPGSGAEGMFGMLGGMMQGMLTDGPAAIAKINTRREERIHGKTPRQLMQNAAEILGREVAKLEQKAQNYRQALTTINLIKVSNPVFHWDTDGGFMGRESQRLEFTLSNETDKELYKIEFYAELNSPGRTEPWVAEQINLTLDPIFKPGQKRQVNYRPNNFGMGNRGARWDRSILKGRSDLNLSLQPQNAVDSNEMKLTEVYTVGDNNTLEQLRKKQTEMIAAAKV